MLVMLMVCVGLVKTTDRFNSSKIEEFHLWLNPLLDQPRPVPSSGTFCGLLMMMTIEHRARNVIERNRSK